MRIDDDDFTMTWEMIKFMFFDTHNLALWAIPLGLAVLLRVITHKYHHQLIFPLCECFCFSFSYPSHTYSTILTWTNIKTKQNADFIIIPVLFYIIVAAAQLDLGVLRKEGWVFDMGVSEKESWYKFYSFFGESLPTSFRPQPLNQSISTTRRFWLGSLRTDMGDSPDAICFVSCFTAGFRRELLADGISDRLFFNILHPPLNVPALCAYLSLYA